MSSTLESQAPYGERPLWRPERPRIRPWQLLVRWISAAAALLIAAELMPGVSVEGFAGGVVVVLLITILNAVLAPLLAALRLPYTALVGFVLVLFLDAWLLQLAAEIAPGAISVDSFGSALLAVLVASGVDVALIVFFGVNDDDVFALRVVERVARRSGEQVRTDVPGLLFLEIDGLAAPVLRRSMRDGSTPEMARWVAEGTHQLLEWETDFSSQTGSSQAGILLGSNDDIPAFRWVEKETGTVMTCSEPDACAEIERRRSNGQRASRRGRRQPREPSFRRC